MTSAAGQAPQPLWDIAINPFAVEARAHSVASDSAGGVYVSGETGDSLYSPSAGSTDAFIARFTSSGSLMWGRQFGGPGRDYAERIENDGQGGVFVVGRMGPEINADAFIARYDSGGTQLWLRVLGTPQADLAYAAHADGTGGAFVVGGTQGTLGSSSFGLWDGFLARYNSAGERLWLEQFGTPQEDVWGGVVPDGAGGIFVGGVTRGAWCGPHMGSDDIALARYTAGGVRTWTDQIGNAASELGIPSFREPSGGFYMHGSVYGSFWGPSAGNVDPIVGRFDATGELVWGRQFGTSSFDEPYGSTTDGAGGIYVVGHTNGAMGGSPPLGLKDAFLTRFTASGQQLWTRQWGYAGAYLVYAHSAAPDGNGGVYVCGRAQYPDATVRAILARFPGPCYPNCDSSTAAPTLNVADFTCFLQRFAAADAYANCDNSTQTPALNVADFTCFLQKFAAGCP